MLYFKEIKSQVVNSNVFQQPPYNFNNSSNKIPLQLHKNY
jgi:hypothetical protein